MPQLRHVVATHAQHNRPGLVTARKKDAIADYHGSCSIDRGIATRPPVLRVTHFAGFWIEQYDAFARQESNKSLAIQIGSHRRRIAGLVLRRSPNFLTRILVECDNSCVGATDIEHE